MKKKSLVMVFLVGWLSLLGFADNGYAQGGGCPANPLQTLSAQYKVIESIELATFVMENTTPNPEAQELFFHDRINLAYQPGTIVLLASTPDGEGALCTDDAIRIESSTGWVFEHDFRSADRSQIVPLEPLDVTALFEPDLNTIDISLWDISPQYSSSSPYYLIVIKPSPSVILPAPANIFTPVPPTVAPTVTLSPSPTVIPAAVPTSTPTPTPTPTPVILPPASPEPPLQIKTAPLPFFALPFVSGLALLIVAVILIIAIARRPRLVGILEITKDGSPWKTVDLSRYGRSVTIGRKGQIKLEDDNEDSSIPNLFARLLAQRGPDGQVYVVWQNIDEGTDTDTDSYQLTHDHVEIIGPYRFKYQNFSEIETVDEALEGGIWNEV